MKRPGIWIAAFGLLLAGCGLFHDPLKDVQTRAGVPLQTKTVTVPVGTLTFYKYVKGQQCGTGFVYQLHGVEGGGGGGEGPCFMQGPLGAGGANSQAGKNSFVLLYGEINDSRITKVTVTLKGETNPLEAQMTDGWWYIFRDGQGAVPDIAKVTGYDKNGAEVASTP